MVDPQSYIVQEGKSIPKNDKHPSNDYPPEYFAKCGHTGNHKNYSKAHPPSKDLLNHT